VIAPEVQDTTMYTKLAGAIAATMGAVGWYFHVRKLRNVQVVDSGVTKSLDVVLKSMRDEIERSKKERRLLEVRIGVLEKELEFLRNQAVKHGLPLRAK
jgi:parvulin-like peptidyl-prolyl isomerase